MWFKGVSKSLQILLVREVPMQLMICIRGEADQIPFLPKIAELGAGVELGSYGLIGVQSEEDWKARFSKHQAVKAQFTGRVAVHGPFVGMEYAHVDHLIRQAIEKRLDMIFDAAFSLGAFRVVLHSGFRSEIESFKLQDVWLERNADFWKSEMTRWERANISIVLENEIERSPDILIKLVRKVDNPLLGLCLDVGHQRLFSMISAATWIESMGKHLKHVHLHDNDGQADRHWPIGTGNIEFEPIFKAIELQAPDATLSLEVEDKMETRLRDLRTLEQRFNQK